MGFVARPEGHRFGPTVVIKLTGGFGIWPEGLVSAPQWLVVIDFSSFFDSLSTMRFTVTQSAGL